MPRIHHYLLAFGTALGLSGAASAQLLNPPTQPESTAPANDDGVEVLARGPIHEAYASSTEMPAGGTPIITKAPPEPIEELPPDQKPEGDNVLWIPGYWAWDEDRSDFLWISGFWRVPPPGRLWVPGSWREATGGFQWVPGFWQDATPEKPEIEYLPPPPAPLETQPSTPAPSESYYYVPGNWVYRNRYVWRPGYWVDHRPNWIWCNAHYRWTPAGYIYVEGYWDYTLADRGVLFAPIYYSRPVYTRPRYYYTPTIVVSEPSLYTSLFIRRGYSNYYFGNYFETTYVNRGYNPWCGTTARSGFSISIGFSTGRSYDPLWSYYSIGYRSNPGWVQGVNTVYTGRYNGTVARPPVNLVQQAKVINNVNVTNVTNNTTVINNNVTNVTNAQTNMTMLTSINNAQTTKNVQNNRVAFKPIDNNARVQEQKYAADLRTVEKDRKRQETAMTERQTAPVKPTDAPRTAKIEVPKTVTARAQIPEAKKAEIPPPAPRIANQPAPKVDPVKPAPKTDPVKPITPPVKPTTPPVTPPKTDPVKPQPPKTDPPKVDPPKPMPPKTDPPKPVNPPKVDPPKPVTPPTPPKVDPPKPVTPPTPPKPVTPPKPPSSEIVPPKPVTPQPAPKVDPPKPVTPPPAPRVDPPKPVTPPPAPRVDPPKPVTPPPAPRVDPPRPVTPPPAPRVDPPKPVTPSPAPKPEPKGDKPKEPKKP